MSVLFIYLQVLEMNTSHPQLPFQFPYGTPDQLSYVPLNPYAENTLTPKHPTTSSEKNPSKRTLDPIVTGTSVLGVRFKDGVMLGADTLTSYGSLARFRTVERIAKVNSNTILGATGEFSDFQYLTHLLEELVTQNEIEEDGAVISPKSIHSYLTRVLYSRRNQFNPLWGQFVVAGYYQGKSTLGLSDLRGTSFEDNHIATGYGAYIARPLLRNAWRPDITEGEAKKLIEDCLRVLFYRDARSYNRIQIATVTARGIEISQPYSLETDWSMA